MLVSQLLEARKLPKTDDLLTPATRKSKREAEKRFAANVKHVKTSGFNQSYAKKHNLDESWVVKNKDGKEKRFKDANSAEAKEWKESSDPKKAEKFSQKWWDAQTWSSGMTTFPDDKIGRYDVDMDLIEKLLKNSSIVDVSNIDHMSVTKQKEVVVDGVKCAAVEVSLFLVYTQDDDIGLDGPTEEVEKITIARNPKNPKAFVLAK